jgi:hypothetical protein
MMDEGLASSSPHSIFSSRHRRRSTHSRAAALVLLVLAVAGAAGTLYWIRTHPAEAPGASSAAGNPAPAQSSSGVDDLASLPLPTLGASDAFIRQMVARVSAHPQWASWLVTDDLVRRFVKTVVAVGRGSSPTAHVEFAAPTEPFTVESARGRLWISSDSYTRYDLLTAAFVSFDTEGAAQVYRKLHPLFEEAYAELGISDHSLDEMMALAVQNLTAVQIPAGPLEVVRDESEYELADRNLERLTPAAKHLLRFGPDNARQVQTKVGEIGRAIGISPL